MNIGIIVLILVAAGLIIGITLAIGRNSNDNKYSSDSSFKLMTVMYTVVAPIILIIAVVIFAFALM
ncbi:hypothetical protein [Salicibibacter kimchii]|uniref:BshB3 potential contributor to bacillithiol synthesis n=1 Tax=Salicibibacter kimchii TaxID=2099786 RepID=A0A345C2F8_9BACI|nr:hypothetical protein [Salicibibacter kimchii]AXF57389.1 hypothetical protein DT065_16250 [Salicibibacter kimchii]